MHYTIRLHERAIRSAPGSTHDNAGVLPGDGSWVSVLSSARLPLETLFLQTCVEDARIDAKEEAPKNREDKTSNLARRNLLFGCIVCGDVLIRILPVRGVVFVYIDNDVATFVILAGNNVVDKVTHLLLVRYLLGGLWGFIDSKGQR